MQPVLLLSLLPPPLMAVRDLKCLRGPTASATSMLRMCVAPHFLPLNQAHGSQLATLLPFLFGGPVAALGIKCIQRIKVGMPIYHSIPVNI